MNGTKLRGIGEDIPRLLNLPLHSSLRPAPRGAWAGSRGGVGQRFRTGRFVQPLASRHSGQQADQRRGVQHRLGHERRGVHPFLNLAAVGGVFGAVGLVAARAETVEGGEVIPEHVAVTETAAFLAGDLEA